MVAAMFIVVGVEILFISLMMCPPLAFLSLFIFAFALIYLWRAGRLGAEIQNDTLIVRSYFQRHDTFVPLSDLLRVHRGACDDATVLEFSDRQFILDDAVVPDEEVRRALFQSLQSYAKSDVA